MGSRSQALRMETRVLFFVVILLVIALVVVGTGNLITGQFSSETASGGGGTITVEGTVVNVQEGPETTQVYVDQNGDGQYDKIIFIDDFVNSEFKKEKYPIGSSIEFDNLVPDITSIGYRVTVQSNKRSASGSAAAGTSGNLDTL